MRFINIKHLTIKNNKKWKRKAMKALVVARSKTTQAERSDYINNQSAIWSELKPNLEKLSNKKCWYCESYEKRSFRVVDHFRPKNNVRDAIPAHNGYWWLAFDPVNYRLSCTFCNSRIRDRETGKVGGKWDYFPIRDESKRVKPEGQNFKRENPVLLDPCNPSDVLLLSFSDDGRAIPAFSKEEKPWAYERADRSIELYNLNEVEIKEARQGIYNRIKILIEDGDEYFQEAYDLNAPASLAFERVIEELARLIHKDSEFSAFSKAIIAGFRDKLRPWLNRIDLLNC
jgi:hypothetical protein